MFQFTIVDGRFVSTINPSLTRSKSNQLVQQWLVGDDGKAFLDSIIKPGDVVKVRVRERVPENRV